MNSDANNLRKPMEGAYRWSSVPYRPCMIDCGDIAVTRLVPAEESIHVEWLVSDAESVLLMYKKRADADYICGGAFEGGEADLWNLETETDYEFYLAERNSGRCSRIRLARTGCYPGTIINYLHPEDEAYSFSGRYLCSPSIVRQADNSLLASMDLYEHNGNQYLTLIYRSDDEGKTWHWQCDLHPCYWGKLFVFRGETYILCCSTEHGDILLGKTTDYGRSFENPTVLLRGQTKGDVIGVDMGPEPPAIYNGRIWINYHWGCWGKMHYACIASAPLESDILDVKNWTFTPCCPYDENWPGCAKGKSKGTLEGTFMILPDNKLYLLTRYDMEHCTPNYGLAILYKVNTDDPTAPLEFERTVEFKGNHSKFIVLHDEVSNHYYSIVSYIRSSEETKSRNLLALFKSADGIQWETASYLIDYSDKPREKYGFQYVDFMFEGDDIYYACRTAVNGANSFHDSNCITFHVIKDFRKL